MSEESNNGLRAENKRLRAAIRNINTAIDEFWNSDHGLRLTGMGKTFVNKITAAQQPSETRRIGKHPGLAEPYGVSEQQPSDPYKDFVSRFDVPEEF